MSASIKPMVLATTFLIVYSGVSTARAAAPAATGAFATLYDLLLGTPELSAALQLFNYTHLLPLTMNPNTTITCFLPSSKIFNATKLIDGWETGSPQWNPQPGRYVWAILLHHCLDGPRAFTLANLTARTYTFKSAFVWRAGRSLIPASVQIKKKSGSPGVIFEDELGNESNVISADLRGGKSVVHIVDNGEQISAFAPSDSYESLSALLWDAPIAAAVFGASSLAALIDNPAQPLTIFVPTETAFSSLFKQLRSNLTTLLSKPALVDLLVRAHLVNGSALFTGALIRYPGPLTISTVAGPVNVTTDLSIFPNRRPGAAKFITLSTPYGSAYLSNYDIGGNGNDQYPPVVPWVSHYLDQVLLPVSLANIRKMLL